MLTRLGCRSAQEGDALDRLRDALSEQQGECDEDDGLDRVAGESARVGLAAG